MKRKSVLVLGIALVLMAIVVGVAFADGSHKGVVWGFDGSKTHFRNNNDYAVTAGAKNVNTDEYKRLHLQAGQTKSIEGHWEVTGVHSF